MNLKDLIYNYRMDHNLSMEEFARQCGVTKGYVSMIESGKNARTGMPIKPTLPTLKKLASGMQMQLDDLLMETEAIRVSLSVRENYDPVSDPAELQLLSLYRQLNDKGRTKMLEFAEDMIASGRYIYQASGTKNN